jgi:two-component sensor histidine kinase
VAGLALVLHGTATNAVKYGALSRPDGSIHVTWNASGDYFILDWDETGGPEIHVKPQTRGFGSTLIDRSVTGELGGRIEHDWLRNGLRLKLSIPLQRLLV